MENILNCRDTRATLFASSSGAFFSQGGPNFLGQMGDRFLFFGCGPGFLDVLSGRRLLFFSAHGVVFSQRKRFKTFR
jgi:hypothetical protein